MRGGVKASFCVQICFGGRDVDAGENLFLGGKEFYLDTLVGGHGGGCGE